MKILKTTASFILLCTITANAQVTKGNWMVGGSGNFTSYKSTFQSNNIEVINTGNGFNISPNLGYFVVDNFAVGTTVGFNFSNPSGANNNSHGYGISPFVRYYFRNSEKIINPFLQTSYGFGRSKSEIGDSNKTSGYSIKAGSAIFFNSSVALELSLNYISSKYNNPDTTYNDFTIGIGFQIHLEK
jgi:hypothetical protein